MAEDQKHSGKFLRLEEIASRVETQPSRVVPPGSRGFKRSLFTSQLLRNLDEGKHKDVGQSPRFTQSAYQVLPWQGLHSSQTYNLQ